MEDDNVIRGKFAGYGALLADADDIDTLFRLLPIEGLNWLVSDFDPNDPYDQSIKKRVDDEIARRNYEGVEDELAVRRARKGSTEA